MKPFALDELSARMRALLRRSSVSGTDDVVRVGDLVLDPQGRTAQRSGRQLDLTKTEFDVLELLMVNAGIVMSRETIYERIWGYDFETSSRSLDVYIGYLRTKTEAEGEAAARAHRARRRLPDPKAMSLRWRIAAALGVVAALVCAFGAIAAYVSTSQRLEDSVDESLLARRAGLAPPTDHGPGGFDRGPTTTGSDGDEPGFDRPSDCPSPSAFAPATSAQFVDVDGTRTSCIEGSVMLPTDATDRALAQSGGDGSRLRTVDVNGESYRILTVARSDGGAYELGRSLAEVDDVLSSLKLRLGLIGAIGVAGAVLAGWLIAGRIVKPVDRLRVTAEDIARTQDLTTPIPTDGAAEIGSLSRSFTTMVDALATSRREQQRLVGDASHELRTPLTSLRTNAELLGAGRRARAGGVRGGRRGGAARDPGAHRPRVGAGRAGRRQLRERRGAGGRGARRPGTRRRCTRARRRSGREIEVTATGTTTVFVRPQMVERAIGNLVDNALKYSPDGASVDVVIDGTQLEVRDLGSGFSDVDLPHVFDRFYRSVEARTQSGSGLGLAIVRQAVERHGGTVWAANRAGGGAAVGFELPAATERDRAVVLTSAARQGAGACVSRSASAFWSPSRAQPAASESNSTSWTAGSAPSSSSHRTVAPWPLIAAQCNPGAPKNPGWSICAPRASSIRATSMLPLRHAR